MFRNCLVLVMITTVAIAATAHAATFTVTKTGDAGAGSLRAAITAANGNGVPDTIRFAAGLKGKIIRPRSSLPPLTDRGTTINGDIDSNGSPDITLSGSVAGGTGLLVRSRNNVIRGLNIRLWAKGIWIFGAAATRNVVAGNYVGTNKKGTWALANDVGIYISGSAANNTIGGTTPADRNVISGNEGIGLAIRASNATKVYRNYIGLDYTGTKRLANTVGIAVYDNEGTRIGNGKVTGRNVISGQAPQNNFYDALETVGEMLAEGPPVAPGGITIFRGARHLIRGNYIGTNATGKVAIGNEYTGVRLTNTVLTTIGGPAVGHRNVISGNSRGLEVGYCRDTVIANNYVGTNAAGTAAVPNRNSGIDVSGSNNTTIGGTTPDVRNVASGNGGSGIEVWRATDTWILGNYVGVDASGLKALGNDDSGIRVGGGALDTWIGSKASGSGNVIAANREEGIEVSYDHTSYTRIMRNIIGRDAGGVKALRNRRHAITVRSDARQTIIGGTKAAHGNRISVRSGQRGINFEGSSEGGSVRYNEVLGPGSAFTPGDRGIHIGLSDAGNFFGRISNNVIRRFRQGLYLSGENVKPVVADNRLSSCDDLIQIRYDAKPDLGNLGDGPANNDGGNIFRNPGTYAVRNFTTKDIKAEGNDWDTTSAAAIEAIVYHKVDSASLGTVDFDPIIGGVSPTGGTIPVFLQVTGVAAVPTGVGAEVVFTLNAPAEVMAQVLNIAGRPVAVLPPRDAQSGLNRLSWNGTSSQGTAAPAGMYLVRLTARAAGGAQTSALATVRLAR